jgi:hypothetical protein
VLCEVKMSSIMQARIPHATLTVKTPNVDFHADAGFLRWAQTAPLAVHFQTSLLLRNRV